VENQMEASIYGSTVYPITSFIIQTLLPLLLLLIANLRKKVENN
jgi:hypothetical protein